MSIPMIKSNVLDGIEGIRHGFTTRNGGVSTGHFSSLNCSPFSEDELQAVEQNRRLIYSALDSHDLVTNRQMHGREVRRIKSGADLREVVDADGIVTRETGICIGALGADCAPVLFADPKAMVIGVAHVGWQGALVGVTDAVVDAMEQMGAHRPDICSAIGPAIQWASYEVGERFKAKFLETEGESAEPCFKRHSETGQIHFDMPLYIETRLKTVGLVQIERSAYDTYTDETQFFSYRRTCHREEKEYGRQLGAICLVQDSSSSHR